jgi:hypothetical protein
MWEGPARSWGKPQKESSFSKWEASTLWCTGRILRERIGQCPCWFESPFFLFSWRKRSMWTQCVCKVLGCCRLSQKKSKHSFPELSSDFEVSFNRLRGEGTCRNQSQSRLGPAYAVGVYICLPIPSNFGWFSSLYTFANGPLLQFPHWTTVFIDGRQLIANYSSWRDSSSIPCKDFWLSFPINPR